MASTFKEKVYNQCTAKLNSQITELRNALEVVKESIANEEKSSVGDKFETARAMAQKEMELLGLQYQKSLNDLKILSAINPKLKLDHVQLGSLVKVKDKMLFIAIAMGKLQVDETAVFVISASSPVGQSILGKSEGFEFKMGDNTQSILSVS